MRNFLLAAGLALGLELLVVSPALAASLTSESLVLDTYSAVNNDAGAPIETAGKLDRGKLYVVTVKGTWSAWLTSRWSGLVSPAHRCGSPESAPMFPSPVGQGTGPVGQDAETMFGEVQRFSCTNRLPREYYGFQMNLGSGFVHYEPYTGATNKPSPNHAYTYVLLGEGSRIRFEERDSETRDNYGEFHITVSLGTETCKKGGWLSYGVFKNQGDCVSYFSTDGRNPPALLSKVAKPQLHRAWLRHRGRG
jgi:hypothetical protein